MPDPADLLSALTASDPTRPRLTAYDSTTGERIELSGKVLGMWVAKAANCLQEDYDVSPGSLVVLDLPAPHWRACYWALATWSVGATLSLDSGEGADVLVTHDPGSPATADADEVVAVTLPALARAFDGQLATGVMDEAAELSGYGDTFTAWEEPDADDVALAENGERMTYADLAAQTGYDQGVRLLVTDTDPARALRACLQAWAADGSVVLVTGDGPQPDLSSEAITAQA